MSARTRVPCRADERTMLLGFLTYQRQTFRVETDGPDAGLLAATHPHQGHADLIRESMEGFAS